MPFSLILPALDFYLCPAVFTAWLMIPAVPCHSLSFQYHSTARAWLVQIRCALNLNISVEWELLDGNTSPGLQWDYLSTSLTLFATS